MTRLWFHRILLGTLCAAVLGAILGGVEVALVLRGSVTELVNALQRLQLWGGNALAAGAVSALIGAALSGAVGAVAGLSSDDQSLAIQTGRDPVSPWLPWVLGGTLLIAGGLLITPGLLRALAGPAGPARLGLSLLVLVATSLGVTLLARLFLHRLDVTGRGMGIAILGLPALLLITMSLAVSASMVGGRGTRTRAREGTPNLLLITVDGLRADHVGAGARVRTPTLQWMARKGVTFTQATTPSTSEAPPLGAVMTGRHPLVTGFLADGQALPELLPGSGADLPTLAEKLRAEGYSTGAFLSSAALDGPSTGLDRGFTVYDDGLGSARRGGNRLALPTLWRWLTRGTRGPSPPQVLRSAAETVARLGEWMSWHHGENQFAWLHLSEPRNPTLGFEPAPEDLIDPIPGAEGRAYGARVVGLDEVMGDLLQGLEADGMLDDWLVLVVGSRGRVPGAATPNVGEAWAHVPFILFGPGLPSGGRVDAQVRLEDVPATALTAMGFVKRRFGDGYSLMSMVAGADLGGLRAITISPPRAEDGRAEIALRQGRTKFVRDIKGVASFYDLQKDPREVDDAQERFPAETAAAKAQVQELLGKAQPAVVLPDVDPARAATLRVLRGI